MLDKMKNKIQRKQNKALKIAKKDYDIDEVESGKSRYLLICNAGLMTGISRESLLELLSPFGSIERIILIPGKSFSFVVYSNAIQAQDAVKNINTLEGENSIILVSINQVPEDKEKIWADVLPPGSLLHKQFLSEDLEKQLLDFFMSEFSQVEEKEALKNRQVKHYGFEFNYDTNDIDADAPIKDEIPEICQNLFHGLVAQNLIPCPGDQLTVNLYQPGQGIPPHTDSHSCCTDWLCSISLGSGVLMEFKDTQGMTTPVWLPPRSVLVLTNESRYTWKHGITPRQSDIVPNNILNNTDIQDDDKNISDGNCVNDDNIVVDASTDNKTIADAISDDNSKGLTLVKRGLRISLTLRKATNAVCTCSYPEHCDDTKRRLSSLSLEDSASAIEQKMVHSVYEEIASHFSETRHKPWPSVVQFIQTLPPHGVMVDVGCGNGKYLDSREDLIVLGTDFSHNLLKIVLERGFPGMRCDMLSLGLRDSIADGIICIAALHHLTTDQRRIIALKEMMRVLKDGGKVLVYVWAKDQKKEKEMSSYLKQNKKNLRQESEGSKSSEQGEFGIPVHQNRTEFKHQDVLVPWKLKSTGGEVETKTFKRYYHVFEERELECLMLKAGFTKIVESYYDQGNWCAVAQK